MPSELWDALDRQQTVITPGVLFELRQWLDHPYRNSPFNRRVRAAIKQNPSSVHLLDMTDFSTTVQAAAKYYIQLLCVRRLVGCIEQERFLAEERRPPTDDELAARCKRITGERGWQLAEKGMAEHGKITFGNDEELVVWAVLSAVLTGRETVILTRDTDVMEQFYKMVYLLDTNYRSCLIARAVALYPSFFPDVPTDKMPGLWEVMDSNGTRVMRMPYRFDLRVLPPRFTPVSVQCWLIGGDAEHLSMAQLPFLAEREMCCVIRAKGGTGGMNTALLNGLNCHRCFCPHLAHVPAELFVVGRDRHVNLIGLDLPVVDVELCVRAKERTERVQYYRGPLFMP